ncbi:MAG: phBC6A51 family helix-turn-helix protein [Candidatus Acidiferrales bacterium]
MSEETKNKADEGRPEQATDVRKSTQKAGTKTAFIEWLALPSELREPKTAREFAAMYEVAERTLYRWRTSEELQKRVRQLANRHAMAKYADVVSAVVKSAIDGDTTAQKFYFQQFVPQTEQNAPQETEFRILIGGKPAPPLPIGVIDGRVGLVRIDANASVSDKK